MASPHQLRAAITALYSSTNSEERQAADHWLRSFIAEEGAWHALLDLLSDASASDQQRYFAAASLRPACQRQRALAEPVTAAALLPLLAQQYAATASAGCWHTANQLAAALASLALRAPCWPEQQLLPQLVAQLHSALSGSDGSAAGALVPSCCTAEQQQVALLRMLAVLAEAACSPSLSMHPQRRAAVCAALACAHEPLVAVQHALLPSAGSPACTAAAADAALQLLQSWCTLGVPPAGADAEGSGALWWALYQATLHSEAGAAAAAAAEALAALFAATIPATSSSEDRGNSGGRSSGGGGGARSGRRSSASGGTSTGSGPGCQPGGDACQLAVRRAHLLATLLGMLPGYAAGLQQALSHHAHAPDAQAQLLFAALTVLGAAARAADSQCLATCEAAVAAAAAETGAPAVAAAAAETGAAAGTAAAAAGAAALMPAALAEAVQLGADLALAALQHPHFQVGLAALQYWDEQMERWQQQEAQQAQQQQRQQAAQQALCGARGARGACTPQQRRALLERLCGALLQRMALPAAGLPPSCLTADARDLPDEVQLVRREVADSFRTASECLGPAHTRQHLLQLVPAAAQAASWQQYECVLYALNLIWNKHRSSSSSSLFLHHHQAQQQRGEEEVRVAEVRAAAAAVAAALHPSAPPKLAGTALTLLGGMADQLPMLGLDCGQQAGQGLQYQQYRATCQQQPQPSLQQLLGLVLHLVQQAADEKLSRNAATCCHRLSACRPLAELLAACYPGWGDALCACFAATGGMRQRAQAGEDLATSQFLLASICRLAAAAAASGAAAEAAAAAPPGAAPAAAPPPAAASANAAQLITSSSASLAVPAVLQLCGSGTGGSSASGNDSRQAHGVALLQRLLSQPAAAADAALTAAAAGAAAGGAARRQQQEWLDEAAVQVESIAVALEAVTAADSMKGSGSGGGSGSGSGGIEQRIPDVLAGPVGEVLQKAAATAAAAVAAAAAAPEQPAALLLQGVCRVAGALAPTPAFSFGLHLLQPCVAAPQHPCVLLALAELVSTAGASWHGHAGSSYVQCLQATASGSLQAAASRHGGDADWQPALLQLGCACLAWMPAVAAQGASLDSLLTTAQHSMQSYHRDVCEQVLRFAEALCCIGCGCGMAATAARLRRLYTSGGSSSGAAASVAAAAHPVPCPAAASNEHEAAAAAAAAAELHLQQRLDGGGLGAALVLGMLMAAAGSMPPYMVAHIADALHRTWRAVGGDRFGVWLHEAALQRAPDAAPWRRWKADAQVAAVGDLLAPQCAADARRFKRLLKVFCGGKKKGQHVDQPARG